MNRTTATAVLLATVALTATACNKGTPDNGKPTVIMASQWKGQTPAQAEQAWETANQAAGKALAALDLTDPCKSSASLVRILSKLPDPPIDPAGFRAVTSSARSLEAACNTGTKGDVKLYASQVADKSQAWTDKVQYVITH